MLNDNNNYRCYDSFEDADYDHSEESDLNNIDFMIREMGGIGMDPKITKLYYLFEERPRELPSLPFVDTLEDDIPSDFFSFPPEIVRLKNGSSARR